MPSWKTTKKAYTRFLRAASAEDLRTLVWLVRRYPELRDFDGPNFSPLHIVRGLFPEALDAVLTAGLSPDAGAGGLSGPLLLAVAAEGELALVECLLRHGADTEARNSEGETPLGFAVAWGQRAVVETLLAAGAEVNAIEDNGVGGRFTALDATNDPELIAYLRARGAKTLAELEAPGGAV